MATEGPHEVAPRRVEESFVVSLYRRALGVRVGGPRTRRPPVGPAGLPATVA